MKDLVWIVALTAHLPALLMPAQSSAQAPRLSDAGQAAIGEYLGQVERDTYIPGIVALVTNRDDAIYAEAFGSQDVAQARPMSVNSIFAIASMAKPITSAAVMMLIEDGELALDDPVSMYLPGHLPEEVFDTVDPGANSFTARPVKGEITVRHLLTHTSGLGYAIFSDILFPLLGDVSPPPSGLEYPLLHDPGAKWTYGESTRVLGVLVEKISGQGFDVFLRERIFAPLGMRDTSYVVSGEDAARLVTLHTTGERGLVERPNPEGTVHVTVRGDGNLFSTASDYARFIRMILNKGVAPNGVRLLEEATVDLMAQNQIGDLRVQLMPAPNTAMARPFPLGAGSDTFGLGFQITAVRGNSGMRSPGSLSWAGINNTEFWIDPDAGIGAVLLMQYRPFYDSAAIEALQGFEARVYENLQ